MYARELFSAGVLDEPVLLAGLVVVIAGAAAVAGATALWIRRRWREEETEGFRAALVCSSLTAAPALLLALELVARAAAARLWGIEGAPSGAWFSTWWAGVWTWLGPWVLYWGIGERHLQTTPRGLTRLQASQVVLWLAASALAHQLG
jgi:hypothetical protein